MVEDLLFEQRSELAEGRTGGKTTFLMHIPGTRLYVHAILYFFFFFSAHDSFHLCYKSLSVLIFNLPGLGEELNQ